MASIFEEYYRNLGADEKMLITLRDELYEGSWATMLADLKDRLKGKPYIFKLANRIQDDIVRIEKLRDYEKKNKINLADYARGAESK